MGITAQKFPIITHLITASLHEISLPPCHCITASLHKIFLPLCHCITISLHHCISQSFALPPATKPVGHLPYPLPQNQSVIWLALYHHITASPCHCVTMLVSHLLWPCHQTGQSFALPPSTKPVNHLTCPLPLHHHVTTSLCHHITMSPHHCMRFPYHRITTSLHEICLPLHHASLHYHVTVSPCHHITVWDFSHHIGMNLTILSGSPPQPIRSSAFSNLINIKSWFFPHHLFEKVTWNQNRWISWL